MDKGRWVDSADLFYSSVYSSGRVETVRLLYRGPLDVKPFDVIMKYNPKPGDLVEITGKLMRGKIGIVIEHAQTYSSPNIWNVLVEDRCWNMHVFYIALMQRTKKGIT